MFYSRIVVIINPRLTFIPTRRDKHQDTVEYEIHRQRKRTTPLGYNVLKDHSLPSFSRLLSAVSFSSTAYSPSSLNLRIVDLDCKGSKWSSKIALSTSTIYQRSSRAACQHNIFVELEHGLPRNATLFTYQAPSTPKTCLTLSNHFRDISARIAGVWRKDRDLKRGNLHSRIIRPERYVFEVKIMWK